MNGRPQSKKIDVARIRRRLELSQRDFAALFHIPLGTLRGWEQGRRAMDAPALALLTIIDRDHYGAEVALNPAHAGLFPNIPVQKQTDVYFTWSKDDFLNNGG